MAPFLGDLENPELRALLADVLGRGIETIRPPAPVRPPPPKPKDRPPDPIIPKSLRRWPDYRLPDGLSKETYLTEFEFREIYHIKRLDMAAWLNRRVHPIPHFFDKYRKRYNIKRAQAVEWINNRRYLEPDLDAEDEFRTTSPAGVSISRILDSLTELEIHLRYGRWFRFADSLAETIRVGGEELRAIMEARGEAIARDARRADGDGAVEADALAPADHRPEEGRGDA